jgi:hypothetical protein
MRKDEILIGTREDFENYFYEFIGVIKKNEEDENISQIEHGEYYIELSEVHSIKNQLDRIEQRDPKFGMLTFLKYEHNKEMIVTTKSYFIWLQEEESNKTNQDIQNLTN